MGLIHACQLYGVNTFDSLVELQRHSSDLVARPRNGCRGMIAILGRKSIPPSDKMNQMSQTELSMAKRQPQSQPTWTDVKAEIASLDRLALTGLLQDLYAASKDNQTFLHTRFGLGEDVLKPYKEMLDRWLWPDVLRNQNISVAKAKQAISSYRKAVGDPSGLAELMVYYCECAVGFCSDICLDDEGYFNTLVNMFEQALKVICQLPARDRDALIARLKSVRTTGHNLGYGVGDDMDSLLAEYVHT